MKFAQLLNGSDYMKQKLYNIAPVFMQNVFTTLYGYKLKNERYGKEYKRKKKYLKKLYQKSQDELKNEQLKNLKKFIRISKKKSPYYRKILKGIRIKSLNDLNKIKSLTKEDLRNNINDIRTSNSKDTIVAHTGGTTGKSLTVFYENKDFQHRMAYLDYFRESHGAYHGMRRASFGGRILIPPKDEKKNIFWRTNYALKQRLYSTYHTSEKIFHII